MHKKLIFILLVVLLTFFISACAPKFTEAYWYEKKYYASYPIETARELRRYESSGLAPEGFVNHKCVRFLGDFDSLIMLNMWHRNSYMYNITDTNGYQQALYVYHDQASNFYDGSYEFPTFSMDASRTDLLDSGYGATCRIIREDIAYKYAADGTLGSIEWYIDDVRFVLHLDQTGEYPQDGKETFLSKLLSLDDNTANEAINEFISTYRKSLE
jgi:hypothetical protein